MNLLCCNTRVIYNSFLHRAFSCSSVSNNKRWRESRGLALNRNAEGILTDGPDYTYLDGRPTPLLNKQKLRIMKQRDIATKIVESISELDFAKERYQNMVRAAAEEKQSYLDNRLKPKGKALRKK